MVTLARKPVDLDLQISEVDDDALPGTTERGVCPRCTTQLVLSYDEPECLNCGYADYAYTEEFPNRDRENLLSSATCYVFRYIGESENLMETLTKVKVVRINNRVGFDVNCPFCERIMEESSLSGKRSEARERRFKCDEGHRVSLIPGRSGMDGWR